MDERPQRLNQAVQGWYPISGDQFELGWWNGERWTGDRRSSLASPVWRILAVSVDLLVVLPVGFALGLILAAPSFANPIESLVFECVGQTVFFTIYQAVSVRWLSATPGLRLFSSRIVDGSGGRLSWSRALIRGFLVSLALSCFFNSNMWFGVTLAVLFSVSCLWILFDPRKQALHDKIAGSFVVRMPWNLVQQASDAGLISMHTAPVVRESIRVADDPSSLALGNQSAGSQDQPSPPPVLVPPSRNSGRRYRYWDGEHYWVWDGQTWKIDANYVMRRRTSRIRFALVGMAALFGVICVIGTQYARGPAWVVGSLVVYLGAFAGGVLLSVKVERTLQFNARAEFDHEFKPTPGWYSVPPTNAKCWWDGQRWTDQRTPMTTSDTESTEQ